MLRFWLINWVRNGGVVGGYGVTAYTVVVYGGNSEVMGGVRARQKVLEGVTDRQTDRHDRSIIR